MQVKAETESSVEKEDLQNAEAEIQEDPKVESSPEEDQIQRLAEALLDLPNPPDAFQLEQWKNIHGQIHASTILGDENTYVWKTLKRADYKNIIASGAANKEDLFQDAVVNKCLLYPSPKREWFVIQDAGTIPSLHKQIMFKSGFVSEEMILSLIDTI